MSDTNTILSMTEHVGFVWSCYALTAVVLAGLVASSLSQFRKTRTELDDAGDRSGRSDNET